MHFDNTCTKIEFYPNNEVGYMLVRFKNDKNDYYYLKSTTNISELNILGKFKEINVYEEDKILTNLGFSLKEKQIYGENLSKFGLAYGYKIYKLLKNDNKIKYESKENKNDLVLYIVLRNDLNLSVSQKAVYVSETTRYLMDEAFDHQYFNMKALLSTDINTVILQASEKDLFEDNFIPSQYDNKHILFTYVWDNEQRVAHHNFRLKEGKTVALAYFGIKKDMPKFLRKLKLYGE